MAKTLVIAAHGLGNQEKGFGKAWEKILRENHPNLDFDFKEFYWEDLRDTIQSQFPLIENNLAETLEKFKFPELKEQLDDEDFQLYVDYVMDALIYLTKESRWMILNMATHMLHNLVTDRMKNTVLIGHSLGSILMTQVMLSGFKANGNWGYKGLIQLGSPMSIRSPLPGKIDDFQDQNADILGMTNRTSALKFILNDAHLNAPDRIKIIVNKNDPTCSDVATLPGDIDLIPIKQGYQKNEVKIFERLAPDTLHYFEKGSRDLDKVFKNHAVELYLNSGPFKTAFEKLVS